MKDAETYRGVTIALLVACVVFSIPAVVAATALVADSIVDEVWAFVAAAVTFLFASGLAISAFESIRARRGDGYFARRFPGYARGRRFPIFDLMRHAGPGFDRRFDKPDRIYALGEADDGFFVIANTVNRRQPDELPIAGEIVATPDGRRGWFWRKSHIIAVDVIERDDAQIAEAAVDRRDISERVGTEIAARLTGTKMKTTITPYAAYIVVTLVEVEGAPSEVLIGIPSDVSEAALKAMRDGTPLTPEDQNWLLESAVDKGVDGIKDYAIDTADHHARLIMGDRPVDLAENAYGMASDAIDYGKDALSWLDPNAATIATTQGARGRAMAWLIATRIRASAGLNDAYRPGA